MERYFCLNWPAIIEEARQRRKSQRLTQFRLAEMAGVSTPTISRFENGEKDIQLSTIISILTVLGMNDQRQLAFPHKNEHYDSARGSVMFSGQDGDKVVECAISREALEDHFNADDKDLLRVFQSNRERIQHEARRSYLMNDNKADTVVLLKSEDL